MLRVTASSFGTLSGSKARRYNNFSQEDASNLQTVVQQVAQMDDDSNNPSVRTR